MLRLLSALCLLSLFLTACLPTSNTDEEEIPNFDKETIDRMLAQQQGGKPQQISLTAMIAQAEASIANFPSDTTGWYNLAKLTYEQYLIDSSSQWLQKTITYYGQVVKLDPEYEEGRAYYNRMLAKLQAKQYDQALSDLQQFETTNQARIPINTKAMEAEILFQQGKTTAACQTYQLAQEIALRDNLPTGNEELWTVRCP